MLTALTEDLSRDVDSDDLRVIIISAEGPVYSSGHDLKELVTVFFVPYSECMQSLGISMIHILLNIKQG